MSRSICLTLFVCLAALLLSGCGRESVSKLDQAKKQLFENKFAGALASCDELLAKDADHVEVLLLRGQVYEKTGRLEEALADYSHAIDTDPHNAGAYFDRYLLYTKMAERSEDPQQQQRYLERASDDRHKSIKYNPDAVAEGLHQTTPRSDIADSDPIDLPGVVGEPDEAAEADANQDPFAIENVLALQNTGPAALAEEDPIQEKSEVDPEETKRTIQQRDLAASDDLPEVDLPPHMDLDLTDKLPPIPVPQIVRFDLPYGRTPSTPAQRPQRHTTGIRSGEPAPETEGNDPRETRMGPRLPGSSFDAIPRRRATGIRSDQGLAARRAGTPSRRAGRYYAPWLLQSPHGRGVRPGAVRESAEMPSGPGGKPGSAPDAEGRPAQVISMALPNTELHGARGATANLLPVHWTTPTIPTTGTNTLESGSR